MQEVPVKPGVGEIWRQRRGGTCVSVTALDHSSAYVYWRTLNTAVKMRSPLTHFLRDFDRVVS